MAESDDLQAFWNITFLSDYQSLKTKFIRTLLNDLDAGSQITPELLVETHIGYLDCFVGVKESEKNCGKEVEKFQDFTHTRGQSWGTSFLCFILNDGIRGVLNGFSPVHAFPTIIPLTGTAQKIMAYAEKEGCLTPEPKPGDLAVVKHNLKTHLEGVISVDDEKLRYVAIGGNVSIKGALGGDGIYRISRSFKSGPIVPEKSYVSTFIDMYKIYEKLIEGRKSELDI
jgi:hypothetical protein